MNTAIVMLGSNTDALNNLNRAKELLSACFEIVKESSVISSKPVGKNYKSEFSNKAVILLSVETEEETKSIFKDIETEMGRTQQSKKTGIVPIDIDLIFWNDKQVHVDYDRFDFVRNCIKEIW